MLRKRTVDILVRPMETVVGILIFPQCTRNLCVARARDRADACLWSCRFVCTDTDLTARSEMLYPKAIVISRMCSCSKVSMSPIETAARAGSDLEDEQL